MTSPVPASDIFNNNPYGSHPSLTTTEAEILWEYAKLAQHVKLVSMLGSISPTRNMTETLEMQGDTKDASPKRRTGSDAPRSFESVREKDGTCVNFGNYV
jgi:hypothetical protein